MKIPLIAGNWKMHKTSKEACAFAELLKQAILPKDVEMLICPPFTALSDVKKVINGTPIKLGAQNMHWETKGPFTGEISGEFLLDLGCEYVILGHSERRQLFYETDEIINKKIHTAVKLKIKPIFCVGELLSEREANKTFDVIKRQVEHGLKNIEHIDIITIAYEPVWAIGTGRNATPKQASEVHRFIRTLIKDKYGEKTANELRILYGGSVNPENIDALMSEDEIDGVLIGGASLKIDSFLRIINFKRLPAL
ncbi:MAG: triose-phosphate isomerase [candidate division WOR-3 bacterium]|nr:triose-phosphate isomerase [candidate division WOR-3 bacterium]